MTVRELRKAVRAEIREINKQINKYREDIEKGKQKRSPLIEKEIEHLQKRYQLGRKGKGKNELSAKNVERSRKAELQSRLAQYNPIKKLLHDDTNIGVEQRQKRFDKAYESYIKTHDYITKDEYSDLIYILQGVKEEIADFGYEDFSNIYAEATTEGKQKFSTILTDVAKESRGLGLSTEDFMDRIRDTMAERGYI